MITGSAGLVGSEAATHFAGLGMTVLGIDNDMRSAFFGPGSSTAWNRARLEQALGPAYRHHDIDVRDREAIERLMIGCGHRVAVVVHAAAQPSHDWAAGDPLTDFDINATGTLNLLESTRRHAQQAVFIFCSTNKVYGDTPNRLPLVELDTRFEIPPEHPYSGGIGEDMSVDSTLHSLFGASKLAADILVQEYGRYYGMATACFRGGTLTGPHHSATALHGFVAYVMRCVMTGAHYTVYGYKGKQVRDAIHSADLIRAFDAFVRAPRVAEVYNIGGGRQSNASVIEAIEMAQDICSATLSWSYEERNRTGDHIWWIGDNGRFASHYPDWALRYDIAGIMEEIYEFNKRRWHR